ncbi:MAG: efflux RND transporter permease subunit [Lachnospiraceae bacterium]
MVVLEFAQSTNMDSVTIEMRESLDQIAAYWPDEVGNPVIMKLNPDMMPVMVAAVEAGDMSRAELTDFVADKVTPELESLEGVASVSTSGDVEEKVGVVLRQEKIDALNKKIQDALDGKFADAEDEIKEQESELAKGKQALEDGQQQLADATSQAEGQLSQGQSEIIKNEMQLDSKLSEVEKQLFYTTGRRTGKLSCCYADGSGDLH